MVKMICVSSYFTDEHKEHMDHLVKLLERGKAFDVDAKFTEDNRDGKSIFYIVNPREESTAKLLDHMSDCDMLVIADNFDSVEAAIADCESRGYERVEYSPL